MIRTVPLGVAVFLLTLAPLVGQESDVERARAEHAKAKGEKEAAEAEMQATYVALKQDFDLVRSDRWAAASSALAAAVKSQLGTESDEDRLAALTKAFRDAGVLSETVADRLSRAAANGLAAVEGDPPEPAAVLSSASEIVFPEKTFDLCWDSVFQDLPVVERWRKVYAEFQKTEVALATAEAEAGPKGPEGMVLVPRGSFAFGPWTGWLNDVKKNKQQKKRVDAFYIDVHEVTNTEYREFLVAQEVPDAYYPEDIKKGKDGPVIAEYRGSHPVRGVTFEAARAYAKWAGKRLPTEAEWEVAARGTDARVFPWGGEFEDDATNWSGRKLGRPTSVGASAKDKSPFGVMDMAGNVSELTSSLAGGKTAKGKLKISDTIVYRGGNFNEGKDSATTTYRWMIAAVGGKSEFVGFRCAMSEKAWKRK